MEIEPEKEIIKEQAWLEKVEVEKCDNCHKECKDCENIPYTLRKQAE